MKWFYNLKIGTKLMSGFIIMALIAATIGVVGILNLQTIDKADTAMYEEDAVGLSYIGKAVLDFEVLRANTINLGMNGKNKNDYTSQIQEAYKSLNDNLTKYEKTIAADDNRKEFNNLKSLSANYKSIIDKIAGLISSNQNEQAANMLDSEAAPQAKSIDDSFDKIADINAAQAKQTSDRNAATANKAIMIMIIAMAIGIAASIILGIFLSSIISKPIKKLQDAANKISNGDLKVNLKIDTKDEVGILAQAFDKIVQSLNNLITDANMLAKAAVEGKLDTRAEASKHNGDYRKIVEGVNNTLDAVIKPLSFASSYIQILAEGGNLEVIKNDYKGDFAVLIDNLNNVRNSLVVLLEESGKLVNAAANGNFSARGDAGKLKGGYTDIVKGINQTLDTVVNKVQWYESILDSVPIHLSVTDMDMNWTFINKSLEEFLRIKRKDVIGKQCSEWNAEICKTQNCGIARLKNNQMQTLFDQQGKNYKVDTGYIQNVNGEKVGHIEVIQDVTAQLRSGNYQKAEVKKLSDNLKLLSEGNLKLSYDVAAADEYTKVERENFLEINNNLSNAMDKITGYINEISQVLNEMSKGNLQVAIESDYMGDFVEIKDSLNNIIESLNEVMGDIGNAASQVASGSSQVSDGSQELSQGATEQASSIEELTASIEEIAAQTKQNAVDANQANELAINAKDNATQGNGQMKQMLSSMAEINESSAQISKIIKVIDEIAFQINILALNAAVEAARAGQHGKGFAVVAEEVRNLAARSANAAKETTALIEGSINKVQAGTKIANDTANALNSIVEGVNKAVVLVGEIATASNEQATGVAQINKGIEQLSQVVQTNSATSEEAAAASEELSSQAEMLKNMVAKFKIKDGIHTSYNEVYSGTQGKTSQVKNKLSTSDKVTVTKNKPKISLSNKDFGKY